MRGSHTVPRPARETLVFGAGFAPTSGCPATANPTSSDPVSLNVIEPPLIDALAFAVMVVAVTRLDRRSRPATLAGIWPLAPEVVSEPCAVVWMAPVVSTPGTVTPATSLVSIAPSVVPEQGSVITADR